VVRDAAERDNEFDGRPDLVKKRARAIVVQRLAFCVVAFFIVATLSILTINAVISLKTRSALLDCTEPSGECAQEGQKRTADVIQQLIEAGRLGDVATQRIVVLAAACADKEGVNTIPEIERCVNDQLKADKEQEGGE
jgi:hypothetical protein